MKTFYILLKTRYGESIHSDNGEMDLSLCLPSFNFKFFVHVTPVDFVNPNTNSKYFRIYFLDLSSL